MAKDGPTQIDGDQRFRVAGIRAVPVGPDAAGGGGEERRRRERVRSAGEGVDGGAAQLLRQEGVPLRRLGGEDAAHSGARVGGRRRRSGGEVSSGESEL